MATVSLVIVGQTLGTLETTLELSDDDAARVLAYALAAYPKPNSAPDPAWSMGEVARISMHDILQKVTAREKKVAAAAAAAAIPDIQATPVEE